MASRKQEAGPSNESKVIPIRSSLEGKEHLIDVNYGSLLYASDRDDPGIYLLNGKSGREVPLLGGHIEVIPTPDTEVGVQENSITIRITHPHMPLPKVLTLTRTAKQKESYSSLERFVITPTTRDEIDLTWKALKILAIRARLKDPELFFVPSDCLGWGNGSWQSVNGYISKDGITVGNGLSRLPRHWPQKINPRYQSLPPTVQADTIRRLLDFWNDTPASSFYPLALLGAAEYVMQPTHEGTARWQLEVFAPSGWMKTTLTNYVLRTFFGSGYSHETFTTMHKDDSKVGRNVLLSRLSYHAFLTYDMNKKPGQADYERQQNDRTDSLSMYGDGDQGPAKANIDGKSLSDRPAHRGLPVRTGEANPRLYTLPQVSRSPEARAVTYIVETSSSGYADEILKRSKHISENCFSEMDAFMIAHVQWLLSFSEREQHLRWKRLRLEAESRIQAEYDTGLYGKCHMRRIEQLNHIVTGIFSLCECFRSLDQQGKLSGGNELAQYVENLVASFIKERLQDSHDLMTQFDEMEGSSPLDAQGQAIVEGIRYKLVKGEYYLENVPDDFVVDRENVGLEKRTTWDYATIDGKVERVPIEKYEPRRGAVRLGLVTQEGSYIAFDDPSLESLIKELATRDRRVSFTSYKNALRDLKKAGITLCDTDRTRHNVRVSDEKTIRKVCVAPAKIWFLDFETGNTGNTGNMTSETALEAGLSVASMKTATGNTGNKREQELATGNEPTQEDLQTARSIIASCQKENISLAYIEGMEGACITPPDNFSEERYSNLVALEEKYRPLLRQIVGVQPPPQEEPAHIAEQYSTMPQFENVER
jgi:hypothetical protein